MYMILSRLFLIFLMLFVVSDIYAQDSALTYNTSIKGTIMMLDNTTPHVAVPIQAILGDKVIAG